MRQRLLVIAASVGLVAGLLLALWPRPAPEPSAAVPPSAASKAAGSIAPELVGPTGQESGASPSRKATLTVRVKRKQTPMEQAGVWVSRHEGSAFGPTIGGVSDASGQVVLAARPGRYAVWAVAPSGEFGALAADAPASASGAVIDVDLSDTVMATGRVLRGGGQAVAGAAVVWVPSDGVRFPAEAAVPSMTDGLGRFSFPVPRAIDEAELEASAPGHGRASVEFTATPTDIFLEPAAMVRGLVLDAAGAPVVGAVVASAPQEHPAVLTDAEGRFSTAVHPRRATLHAQARDGRQALAQVSVPTGSAVDVTLIVEAGSPLEGRVVQSAQPVPGAQVRILSEPDELELARLDTDASGRFAAQGLPAGAYTVSARSASGASGRVVSVRPPLERPVDVALVPRSEIRGTVTGDGDRPLAGAAVRVTSSRSAPAAAVTADDGTFSIDGLEPGNTTVNASFGDRHAKRSLTLISGAVETIDFNLSTPGTLRGSVSGPPRAWSITAGHEGDRFWTGAGRVTSSPSGTFELTLQPGQYLALVSPPPMTDGGDIFFVGGPGMGTPVTIRSGEITQVTLSPPADEAPVRKGRDYFAAADGISFDTVGGDVRVGFLVSDCAAAKAGIRGGDLVVAINGVPVGTSLAAYEQLRKKRELEFVVRREGQDRTIVVK